MSSAANAQLPTPLMAADGVVLMDAFEAILKGALESQVAVGLVAAPIAPRLAGLARAAAGEAAQRLLARHQTELSLGGDGARAVSVALTALRAGRSAVAVVPAADLVPAVDALAFAGAAFRAPDHGLVVLLEDDPVGAPMACPRRLAHDAGLAILEPADLAELRDAIESGVRLSRAGQAPVAVVVHHAMLSAIETVPARPNRVVSGVDELILQRRQRLRGADAGDLLRVARRLELNAITSLPSPGEREVVGFVTVGLAARALQHVLDELGLAGRVPVLRLGLVHPVDEAVLQRFADRVQRIVVLEPRPGSVASFLLEAADALRLRGVRVPPIASREVPVVDGAAGTPSGGGGFAAATHDLATAPGVFAPDDATRPSILARRVLPLLHAVRPSLAVGGRLVARDAWLESLEVPPRSLEVGVAGAERLVRAALHEAAEELRARAVESAGAEVVEGGARALVVDALPPRADSDDILVAEVHPRRRFLREGAEAVRQAARDGRRRLLVVIDVGGSGDVDLARLADSATPTGLADRVRVLRGDANDRAEMRERMLEAAQGAPVTILVLADGPPARLGAEAIERSLAERDRLGYQQQQRLVWAADIACEIRPPSLVALLDKAEEEGAAALEGGFTVEDLGMRVESLQLKAFALSEQVEVVRTKPPITAYSRGAAGIVPPRAVHAAQGVWRAHLAGIRGGAPGTVARILAEAGRAMGYRVEIAANDEPVGRGRRAWAQVLFVRLREGDARAPRTAGIPYGEADLLLGPDGVETLRALGPDPVLRVAGPTRTAIVANDGPLEDQIDDQRIAACGRLAEAVERIGLADASSVDDYASLCRTNLLSERLVDVALLGVAFQRGLVPVSIEAVEQALRRGESWGFGRSLEAFNFGRRLASGGLVRRALEEREPLERLIRRLALELVRERFGGRRRAERFALSASGVAASFARFGDGEEADRAARAAVTALHRSIVWGGTRMMRRFEALLSALLAADPSGALAVVSVEPLANAVLVRDLLYVLAMSTSLEQRRRIRERLGVRASHGDTLERRFLTRFELLAGTRRYRLDLRSSDWPSEVVRLLRPIVPAAFRGESRAQEVRAYAIALAERAARGFAEDPAHWLGCMRRFAMLAADGGLREIGAAELRAGVEGL